MTTSGTTNDNKCQQMTMSDSEWQKAVQRVKTAQHTSKNEWLQFLIHYFKRWMANIRVVK